MAQPYDDFWRVASLILDAMAGGGLMDQTEVWSAVKGSNVSYAAFLGAWVRLSLRGQIKQVGMQWRAA